MSINIIDLSKKYGRREIIERLTYKFENSTHYLIIGDNGIGKSTLFKSIMRQVKYLGICDVDGRISYCPEDPQFPAFMSVGLFIKTFATLTDDIDGIDERIKQMLKRYGIEGFEKKALGSLSKGQKMKINIIQSLLKPSEILLMDEPLSGLDEESKKVLIEDLRNDKRMIIVISHEITPFDNEKFKKVKFDGKRIEEVS